MLLLADAQAHVCQLTSLKGCRSVPAQVQRPAIQLASSQARQTAAARSAGSTRDSAAARRQSQPLHVCWAQAPADGAVSEARQEQQPVPPAADAVHAKLEPEEEEEEGEEGDEDEEDEDWGDEEAAEFVGLSEEELVAQEAAFSQPLLTDEDLAAASEMHVTGYAALVGRPNAGKSTLLNALLGQKLAAVTQKAQTTRHRILGIMSEDDYQLILLDTPGVIKSVRTTLDHKMMHNVNTAVQQADAILVIVDATSDLAEVLDMPGMAPGWSGPPAALVLNKIDLLSRAELQLATKWLQANTAAATIIPVAAAKHEGVDAVKDWAVMQLPRGLPLYPKDSVSEQSERFFVAEIVREHIFLQYHQEVPYCTAVQVTEFTERTGGKKDFIQVTIMVESQSQKPILLGRRGAELKKLSTAARLAIEEFLDRSVYLDLTVKVAPKWRRDEKTLQHFGY